MPAHRPPATPAPASAANSPVLTLDSIAQRIVVLRDQKVLLDADLAALYDVATKRLNEQVRRNRARFPDDFAFQLSAEEFDGLKSQSATSSWGGTRKRPLAFTEHGAIMAASVLNSPRAVDVSVYVVRAFVRLRELVGEHRTLAGRLDEIERKTEALALQHDALSRETGEQLRQVFDALRSLMAPPEPPEPKKRRIGFITEDDAMPKAGKR